MTDYDNQIDELRKHGAKLEAELEVTKKAVEELFRLKAVNEYNNKKYLFDKIEHYLESISVNTYKRSVDFPKNKKQNYQYIRVVPFKRITDNEATFYYAIFVWSDDKNPHITMEKVDNKSVDANYLQVIHYKVFKHFKHVSISSRSFNLNKTFRKIREFYSDFYNFENSTMTITVYSFKVCSDYSQKLLEPYFKNRAKINKFRDNFGL